MKRIAPFFVANALLASGLAFHAFLYNFYLEGLSQSAVVMGRAAAAWSLGALVALLPVGRSIDRWGSKPVIVASALVGGLALAWGAFAASVPAIYASSAVAGAAGMTWRIAEAPILMQLSVASNRSRVFTLNTAFVVAAGAAATAMAGALVSIVQGHLHLERELALTVVLLVGAAISGASAIVYATMAQGPEPAVRERSAASRGQVSASLIVLLALSSVWVAALTLAAPFFNVYFTRTFRMPIEHVSWIFSSVTIATALLLAGAGELATRIGARRAFAAWTVVFGPAMFGLAMSSALGLAVACYFVQSMVSPAANPLLDQMLLESAPAERRGAVSSWRQAMASGGQVLAQAVGGTVLAAGSFPILFACAGGLGLVAGGAAAAATLRLGRS